MSTASSDRFTTIIATDDVARHLDDPRWIIVDCRHDLADPSAGERAFAAGHLPNAAFMHADRDLAGPTTGTNGRHPLPAVADLSARLGEIGIDATSQVVAYDAQGGMMAARLWWMLRWLGHDAVAVMDGGLPRWQTEGRALQSTASNTIDSPRARKRFVAQPRPLAVDAATVLAQLGNSTQTIVDARANDRYRGENETLDPVGGHIPGALNRPFRDNLAANGGFKAPTVLAAEWQVVLAGRAPETVVHQCGSGVSACHNILALAIAGLPTGKLYPGSWSEWCADSSRPVATGPNP